MATHDKDIVNENEKRSNSFKRWTFSKTCREGSMKNEIF